MALRISFSVCVRWSSSLSRSLSDCSDEVVLVSWWSLASRSRTWRSLRSRNARCLWNEEISQQCSVEKMGRRSYAALFCAFRLDCAGVRSSLSTLFDLRSSCPRRAVSLSRSSTIPLSKESLPPPDKRTDEEFELELSCLNMAGALLPLVLALPFGLTGPSKLYSKTAGMKLLRLASKFCSSSMLWSSGVSWLLPVRNFYEHSHLDGCIAVAAHSMVVRSVGIIDETKVAKSVRSWREVRRVVH